MIREQSVGRGRKTLYRSKGKQGGGGKVMKKRKVWYVLNGVKVSI
jgi:hypothetical protein